MRAFMILICAVISSWAAYNYVLSTESLGVSFEGLGVNFSHPNAVALGAAVLFGLLAIALAIEGFTLALKNRQPQFVVMPQWQNPSQSPPPAT